MSFRIGDSHYKDKTVTRPSYLYNGNLYIGKTVPLYSRLSLLTADVFYKKTGSTYQSHWSLVIESCQNANFIFSCGTGDFCNDTSDATGDDTVGTVAIFRFHWWNTWYDGLTGDSLHNLTELHTT